MHRIKPFLNLMAVAAIATGLTVVVYFAGYYQGFRSGSQTRSLASASPAVSAIDRADAPQQDVVNEPTDAEAEQFRIFWEAWALLKDEFYGDVPEGPDLAYAALQGVIRELDDPYTGFLPPAVATLFSTDMEGSFQGIGARVEQAETGGIVIVDLYVDQPAWEAGIRRGDVILAVDGEDITGLTLMEVISRIRGPAGTAVVLTIARPGDEDLFDVEVTRRLIEIPVTESRLLEGNIAYLRLTEFNAQATRRMQADILALLESDPAGFVLDLRGNPGGLLSAAVDIGSFFIPRGNILIESFRNGEEMDYRRRGSLLVPEDLPVVVLVDAGSASASEIVAGALQDAQRALLVGETTLGKGSVQLPHILSDESQLRITIARWLTPARREIHGTGLTPDMVVPRTTADIEAGRDPQLDAAVRLLTPADVSWRGAKVAIE